MPLIALWVIRHNLLRDVSLVIWLWEKLQMEMGHGIITALRHDIHWLDKTLHDMHEGKIVMQFK